jgi:glucose-fructose oxidoreductase
MHCEYTVRAAEAGMHVLCEKPMAVTENECRRMIEACAANNVRLMIAYRLHFEEANLEAAHVAKTQEIGEMRFFSSDFSQQVTADNIRMSRDKGGGTLYDIGVYCINAARMLFRDEPTEVFAFSANNGAPRFREIDEMTSCILRFPNERLATFTCSFGASPVAVYRLVGTRGDLRVEPSYPYAKRLEHYLTIDGKTRKRLFPKRDQFAPEILYFSKCILEHKTPEPDGWEGLADVRIVQALYRSADAGQPVPVDRVEREVRPILAQEIHRPPITKPKLVHAQSPSGSS